MNWLKKPVIFTLLIGLTLLSSPSQGRQGVVYLVSTFEVEGPKNTQYLGEVSQGTLVGALNRSGTRAQALQKKISPEKISNFKLAEGEGVISGKIFVVGNNCRAWIRWKDDQNAVSEKYLEVGPLEKLFSSLENFAVTQLAVSEGYTPPAKPQPKIEVVPEKKDEPVVTRVPAPVEAPSDLPEKSTPIKTEAKPEFTTTTTGSENVDHVLVSNRLPYEVRGLALGDINQDGIEEVLLTGKTELFAYHLQGKNLREVAKFKGEKLDNFVKVDLLSSENSAAPLIVLTNLRGNQVASKILQWTHGKVTEKIKDIPFQLRVVHWDGKEKLLGQPYHGDQTLYPIFELQIDQEKVKIGSEISLPHRVSLYSFTKLTESSSQPFSLATLTPSGKLKLYRQENKKFKTIWTGRESYGESSNEVAVEIKNVFQEVEGDYYAVPNRLIEWRGGLFPELLVSQGDTLLKEVIGRKPVVTRGEIVLLKWNELGMREIWKTPKIDGSILDYLVTSKNGNSQVLVAIRIRDQGFFRDMGKQDSVLLVYNLSSEK
jgi:hypothetical protein